MHDNAGGATSSPRTLLSSDMAETLAGASTSWLPTDRQLVHKAAASEVFVSSPHRVTADCYAVAVVCPQWHHLFRPQSGGPLHPLFVVEALRQAGIALTHEARGIPFGYQFVFQAISIDFLAPPGLRIPSIASPLLLALRLRADQPSTRSASLHLDVEGWHNADRFAVAVATFRCVSAATYARLRAGSLADITLSKRPVEITTEPLIGSPSGDARTEYLKVDYSHPTFFDHAVDHLPGMLLMEAALRAVGVTSVDSWPNLRGFHLLFQRFAELHEPTILSVVEGGGCDEPVVKVTLTQSGHPVATGSVLLASARPSR